MSIIPSFPDSIPYDEIKHEDYLELYPIRNLHADFSYTNLCIWLNLNKDLRLSLLGNSLVLRYSDIFNDNQPATTIIGTEKLDASIMSLFTYQASRGLPQILTMVPEETIDGIRDKDVFIIDDDRDNWDYILDVNQLAAMTGGRFRAFRRKVIRFTELYGDSVAIRELDLTNSESKQQIKTAMKSWRSVLTISDTDNKSQEGLAIERGLSRSHQLPTRALGVFLDGRLEAFCIFQVNKLPKSDAAMAIANHIKCNYTYDKIFDFATFCLVNYLQKIGVEHLNFEQDLGIPGLREHKSLLRPIGFYKKYSVRPAPSAED